MSKYAETGRIYDASDMHDELIGLREDGLRKGAWTGFNSLYDHYSMKLGSFSIIYAAPRQGKSEFIKELVLNTAEHEGWRWLICSPETGSPKEVFAEYASGYLRKPFMKTDGGYNASDLEAERAVNWLSEYIYILDGGLDDITVKDVYAEARRLEREKDIKINGIVIDPYTEMAEEDPSAPIHKTVSGDLNTVRKNSSHNNYHTILSVHTRDIQMINHKAKGDPKLYRYQPEPEITELSGGQMWSRKGFMMVSVWRTPWDIPITDEYGEPYERFQTKINIKKAKPKSAGKEGYVYLYYDFQSGRYYEKDSDGIKRFSYGNPDEDKQRQLNL